MVDAWLREAKPISELSRIINKSWDCIKRHSIHVRDPRAHANDLFTGSGMEDVFADNERLINEATAKGDFKTVVQLQGHKIKLLELHARQPAYLKRSNNDGEGTVVGQWVRVGSIQWYDSIIENAQRIEEGLASFTVAGPEGLLNKEDGDDAAVN